MALKLCVIQFLHGFKDSLFGFIKFFLVQTFLDKLNNETSRVKNQKLKSSYSRWTEKIKELYKLLFINCVLNAIFMLLCILAFNHLIPILNFIFFKIISETYHNWITSYINPVIQILFSYVWILPVHLISKGFNLFVNKKAADLAYYQKYGKKIYEDSPEVHPTLQHSILLHDKIFSVSFLVIFLIQCSIMKLVPFYWLNFVLCHLHLSFLNSLNTFEYKLSKFGWDIERRINYIESRWPYFIGFGLSQSLILACAGSYIYRATLFAFVSPFFKLSSVVADSEDLMPIVYYKQDVNHENGCCPVQIKLPLFRFSLYLTDVIFKSFETKFKKQKRIT